MGAINLAIIPLSLAETLRPWSYSGIRFFLPDEELVNEECLEAAHEEAMLASGFTPEVDSNINCAKGNATPPAYSSSAEINQVLPASSSKEQAKNNVNSLDSNNTFDSIKLNANKFNNNDATVVANYSQASGIAGVQHSTAASTFSFNKQDLNIETWPNSWKMLYNKTSKAPLLWSYEQLGDDLSGIVNEDSKIRSECLKKMIAGLKLPKGSSLFWPFALPKKDKESVEEISKFFYLGMHLFSPKACIFFGKTVPSIPGLELSQPFTQQVVRGKVYVLLPSFSDFEKSENATKQAIAYLKSSLMAFPSLFT